ncbi:MAG: Hsp20/alpha crystallin family protein [Burkholderiales bacterium]
MNDQSTPVARQAATAQAPAEPALLPPTDVIEDAGGITLLADLPGVSKERLHVNVEADTLTVEGEIALPTPEGMEGTHVEVTRPRYRRAFTLSKELDAAKVSAEFANGVLKLRIPKAEHAQPKRIEVKIA